MNKTILAAIAVIGLCGPAWADEIVYGAGGRAAVMLETGSGPTYRRAYITCDVDYLAIDPKPVHGDCRNNAGKRVPIEADWPINLGRYGSKVGLACTIDVDRMGFTCDWR